jgi:hypothetical protein
MNLTADSKYFIPTSKILRMKQVLFGTTSEVVSSFWGGPGASNHNGRPKHKSILLIEFIVIWPNFKKYIERKRLKYSYLKFSFCLPFCPHCATHCATHSSALGLCLPWTAAPLKPFPASSLVTQS